MGALCAAFALPSTAEAALQCPDFTVKPAALRIEAQLADADSFSGSLQLRAKKAAVQPFFLPSELATKDGRTIRPSLVAVTNLDAPLPINETRTIGISIKNVRFAGAYSGQLVLATGDCTVPIRLIATAPADLSLVGGADKALQLRLVRCTKSRCGPSWLDWLVPSRGRPSEIDVLVANAAQSPAVITDIEVALRGDPGRPAVPEDAFVPTETGATLGSQAVSRLPPIQVDRDELEPGHYVGAIYLSVEGAEKRTALPFEVDTRDGPFWAVLVLAIAIVLQILVAITNSLKLRGAEVRRWRKTKRQCASLDAEDQKLLGNRVDATRQLALHGDLQEAKTAREALEKDIGRLAKARRLERRALEKQPELPEAIRTKLMQVRQEISDEDATAADTKLGELQTLVDGLATAKPERNIGSIFGITYARARERGPAWTQETGQAAGTIDAGIRTIIIWISRHLALVLRPLWRVIRAVLRAISDALVIFWIAVMPWLVRYLLVALFILAGLKELYYDNTTFGVEPVLNYGALLIWGVTGAAVNTLIAKFLPGQP
jgi:hypothetical protein